MNANASGISISRGFVPARGRGIEIGTGTGTGTEIGKENEIHERRNPINVRGPVTSTPSCQHLYHASLTMGRPTWVIHIPRQAILRFWGLDLQGL